MVFKSLRYNVYVSSLANYFLNCDVSNNENHRYLPISVIKPNNTIQKDEEEEEIRFENNFEL